MFLKIKNIIKQKTRNANYLIERQSKVYITHENIFLLLSDFTLANP